MNGRRLKQFLFSFSSYIHYAKIFKNNFQNLNKFPQSINSLQYSQVLFIYFSQEFIFR